MADETYDYTKDPDFLKAKPEEQHAYLMANDPEYAKASPQDQAKFRNSVLAPSRLAQSAQPTQFEKEAGAPTALERLGEVTTGFRHPVDELGREAKSIYHNPSQLAGDVSEMAGVPRKVWTDPSAENISQIGGTGIPGMLFGERGLLRHPLEFGKNITGANQAAEDVRLGHYSALPGDIAGGLINLATLKKPAEAGVEAAGEGLSSAKQGLADMARTPENKLKPGTRALAVAGGAGVGHEILPGVGGVVGALAGPSMADFLLPKRSTANPGLGFYSPFDEAEQQAALSGKLKEAEGSRLRELKDEGRLQQIEEREAGKQQKAADVGRKSAPFTGGVAVVPEPRPLFTGEEPNYMASVPRPRLRGLAESGKPGAGQQIQQLGGRVLYTPPGADIESPSMTGIRRLAAEPFEIPGRLREAPPLMPIEQPAFKGGINPKGVEASQRPISPEENISSLSGEIARMKDTLRTSTRPAPEKAQLEQQINEYQHRLDELRAARTR